MCQKCKNHAKWRSEVANTVVFNAWCLQNRLGHIFHILSQFGAPQIILITRETI